MKTLYYEGILLRILYLCNWSKKKWDLEEMSKDKYSVEAGEDHLTYTFYSEGPKGKILKIVLYQYVYENLYNLAFGD